MDFIGMQEYVLNRWEEKEKGSANYHTGRCQITTARGSCASLSTADKETDWEIRNKIKKSRVSLRKERSKPNVFQN